PEAAELLRDIAARRARIAETSLAGPGPEGAAARGRQIAEWMAQVEALEAELARRIPGMGAERRLRAPDLAELAAAIPDGGLLVEYLRVDVCDFAAAPARGQPRWKPARYVAF